MRRLIENLAQIGLAVPMWRMLLPRCQLPTNRGHLVWPAFL
jgi:hypothetical protein